jgi:membrane-bound serine protease (ClpP class)
MSVHIARHRFFAAAIIATMLAWAPVPASVQEGTGGRAVLLDISGAIGPATSEYVEDGFAGATRRGAPLIILRMDTPGGLDSAMRDIIRRILDSPIPAVTYVAPSGARAASAGTYILYASHVAAMAPSTHLGAATPISIGGGFGRSDDKRDDKKDDKAPAAAPTNAAEAKAVNDAVAYIRGLAGLRGRNAEWAEKAVREAATLTASEALEQRVIDVIADDLPDLLRRIDGRTVKIGHDDVRLATAGLEVAAVEPDWRTRILATITNPNLAYILLLAGFYGILFEFISPGAVAPGVIGGISLLVGLYALNLLPVNYAGFALLLFGMALMVAEVFIGSFGIIGIGGVIAFLMGSLLLFRGDVPGFELSLPIVAGATMGSAAFFMVAIAAALRAHRRPVVTGEAELVGSIGRVLWWDNGEGDVHAHGERWHAHSTAALVTGDRVRIVERRGLNLLVELAGEPIADDPRR